ncbi:MAG TPA: hypothetical protein VF473_03070 [Cyclobacteriaceae bacterium]
MKQRTTKSVIMLVLAMIMSVGSFAAPAANEVIPATTTPVESPANKADMERMMNRLEEIKSMDLENMPRSEKRKYAKEVKQIQKKMKALNGGVYISAGALLVILILLLILL